MPLKSPTTAPTDTQTPTTAPTKLAVKSTSATPPAKPMNVLSALESFGLPSRFGPTTKPSK
jgi:hypothetical protein